MSKNPEVHLIPVGICGSFPYESSGYAPAEMISRRLVYNRKVSVAGPKRIGRRKTVISGKLSPGLKITIAIMSQQ